MNVLPVMNSNVCNSKNDIKSQNPSFKSVIPVKVFIDNSRSVEYPNIKKSIRALSKILTTPTMGDAKLVDIKLKFINAVNDFYSPFGVKPNGRVIRNYINKDTGEAYLFTGEHAEVLNKLGKKIGPEKSIGLERANTSSTFEARDEAKSYFDKIKEFINNPEFRLKTKDGADETGLHIFNTSEDRPHKKGFKVNVNYIAFRKVKNQ